ncbi:hypothetical protein HFP15_10940 [Amycolatopsis sp. K13G38]|uniref:Flagellar basal body-associated protein FliL n=1 Tax=Amycolatopsis acididurans TaxID=2724524 RepID=A0ABX1J1Y5_9PSEU|nr:hypothetical protein [Amycolatopsis acididurans]NKQ53396.1 hypothetical protein [Amycolatopsis acididurans]
MSWQDELRRLDAELAGGKISLHEHRKQRDELLAAASGGFAPSPVAAPLNPPPSTPPPPEPPRKREQEQSASAALLATTRPTTAPSPADERPTEKMPYPRIHEAPTVVTRAIGPLPGLTPPRRSEVPPLPTVPVQRPRRKPTWLFLALGVVLVLAMIIGATVFLNARDDSSATAPTPANVAPADALGMAEAKLPTLPGAASPDNGTLELGKAVSLQLITQADADLMRTSGADKIVFRASADPANSPNGTMTIVVPASAPATADQLAMGLRKELTGYGFTMSPLGQSESELAFVGSNPSGRVMALWYSSGSLAVGMGVSQPLTGDPAELRSRLDHVRAQVTAALPAS